MAALGNIGFTWALSPSTLAVNGALGASGNLQFVAPFTLAPTAPVAVNGVAHAAAVTLAHGDHVQIADQRFTVEIVADVPRPKAAAKVPKAAAKQSAASAKKNSKAAAKVHKSSPTRKAAATSAKKPARGKK